MSVTLTVRDETTSGDVYHELPLEFPTERITVRELIRERVYQEVQDFNRKRERAGLSRPGAADGRGARPERQADRVSPERRTARSTGSRNSRRRSRPSIATATSS